MTSRSPRSASGLFALAVASRMRKLSSRRTRRGRGRERSTLLCGSVSVEARTHTHAHHPQLPASATFDVTTYGALGDGVTDDSAAVAKAASAMEACNCIGTLYFPAGHFVLNNSYDGEAGDAIIALRTPGQYTILGAGVDATILRCTQRSRQPSAVCCTYRRALISIICSLLVSNKTPRHLIRLREK